MRKNKYNNGCVSYQVLVDFRNKAADLLEEYANDPDLYDGYVFSVYPSLDMDIKKSVNITDPNVETFALCDLICQDENGKTEVDYDKIEEMSNQLIFVA